MDKALSRGDKTQQAPDVALVRNDKDIGNSGKLTGMDGSERKGGWVALDVVIVFWNTN